MVASFRLAFLGPRGGETLAVLDILAVGHVPTSTQPLQLTSIDNVYRRWLSATYQYKCRCTYMYVYIAI